MTKCTKRGCRSYKTICQDCGRTITTIDIENLHDWFNTKDLPPHSETVLVSDGKQVLFARYKDGCWLIHPSEHLDEVRWWCPIPELPEGK